MDLIKTEEEFREYMYPGVYYKGERMFDMVCRKTREEFYFIDFNGNKIIPDDNDFYFDIKIDPRYEYDQNRTPIKYKEEYKGAAEKWTWGIVPAKWKHLL